MNRRIVFFAAGLSLICASALPQAQQGQPSQSSVTTPSQQHEPAERTGGRPARAIGFGALDVEVTEKSGKAIKGLHADQFSVTDDGKPQKISIFSYSDIEKLETAGSEDTTPLVVAVDNSGPGAASDETLGEQLRDRRLIVLFFDLTSMQTDDILRAHDAAEKYRAEADTACRPRGRGDVQHAD